jgi:hypothetical protein
VVSRNGTEISDETANSGAAVLSEVSDTTELRPTTVGVSCVSPSIIMNTIDYISSR